MSTDVVQEIVIAKQRAEVAAFVAAPDNDPIWIGGVVESNALSEGPISPGSKVKRVAKFLGKRMDYVTEVVEYDPLSLLAMRTESGPLPMTIRYQFEEVPGGTLIRVHVQGEPGGFYKLTGPLLNLAVKRSLGKDLARLKRLLEARAGA